MSTLNGIIQTANVLIYLFGFLDALVIAIVFVYRFVRRVRGKLAEPVRNSLFIKYFALWTLMILIIPTLAASALAVMLFFWTESTVASLAFFALWVVLALFVWLMPWVVPALEETVREYLKKRYG